MLFLLYSGFTDLLLVLAVVEDACNENDVKQVLLLHLEACVESPLAHLEAAEGTLQSCGTYSGSY